MCNGQKIAQMKQTDMRCLPFGCTQLQFLSLFTCFIFTFARRTTAHLFCFLVSTLRVLWNQEYFYHPNNVLDAVISCNRVSP
jgi:hypothetical protein